MKVSSLTTLQFAGMMVILLVGVGIVFRTVEKMMYKKKMEMQPTLPTPQTVPQVPAENTAIDTTNGLVGRVLRRY